ncbi:MAG: HTTM domain-containing protein [Planctomycetota bacterium]
MKAILKRWNDFWFGPIDPLPAALCRICLGVLIIAMYAALAPNWERFFAADGIMSLGDSDLNEQRFPDWWCVFGWTEGWLSIGVYWWIGILAAGAFTVGWRTHVATFVLFVLQSSMIHRDPYVMNGEDMVFRMMLFYGCFAPWGRRLSLDAWFGQRNSSAWPSAVVDGPPLAWPIRLMQVNIALIYAISLPYKFAQDADWVTGDALHWTIASDTWWVRGFLPELTYSFGGVLRKMATWGTVLVEGSFPILVCFRRTRIFAVLSIAALHLGIALLIPHVTLFTLAMVAAFWVYIPAEMIEQGLAWLRRVHQPLARSRRVVAASPNAN